MTDRTYLARAAALSLLAAALFTGPLIGIGPPWIDAGPSGGPFDLGRCELHSENTCSSRIAFARLGAICVAAAWIAYSLTLLADLARVRRNGPATSHVTSLVRSLMIAAALAQGLLLLLWSNGGGGFGRDPWKAAWMLLVSAALMVAIRRSLRRRARSVAP